MARTKQTARRNCGTVRSLLGQVWFRSPPATAYEEYVVVQKEHNREGYTAKVLLFSRKPFSVLSSWTQKEIDDGLLLSTDRRDGNYMVITQAQLRSKYTYKRGLSVATIRGPFDPRFFLGEEWEYKGTTLKIIEEPYLDNPLSDSVDDFFVVTNVFTYAIRTRELATNGTHKTGSATESAGSAPESAGSAGSSPSQSTSTPSSEEVTQRVHSPFGAFEDVQPEDEDEVSLLSSSDHETDGESHAAYRKSAGKRKAPTDDEKQPKRPCQFNIPVIEEPAGALICPITHELFQDPVVALDGFTYEQWAIEKHFEAQGPRSPKTNLELHSETLTPNINIRSMVQAYKEKMGLVLIRLIELSTPQLQLTTTARAIATTRAIGLIESAYANLEARRKDDRLTPLLIAADLRVAKVVGPLLSAGADVNAKDGDGKGLLDRVKGVWDNGVRVTDELGVESRGYYKVDGITQVTGKRASFVISRANGKGVPGHSAATGIIIPISSFLEKYRFVGPTV